MSDLLEPKVRLKIVCQLPGSAGAGFIAALLLPMDKT